MTSPTAPTLPFETIALLLQGGGALGAYQGGVYEALREAGLTPNWVAGISIGAINAAIIAGNRPEDRVAKLEGFWQAITTNPYWDKITQAAEYSARGDTARSNINQFSAGVAMTVGVPGFFKPHVFPPFVYPPGSHEAVSYYNVDALANTLMDFVDFSMISDGDTRLTLGAVNIRTGNFTRFDSWKQTIGVEHIMASGALPPGFPPIEIQGDHYWDGGLISNTPLEWLIDNENPADTLAFQVDLWSAEGELPKTMVDVITRQKEIQYSSRTRASTERFRTAQRLRHAFAVISENLPDPVRQTPEYQLLMAAASHKIYNIVHLIYRSKHYEGHSKDYEFSRQSMEEHWLAGLHDTVESLKHPEIFQRPSETDGIATFDFNKNI